jgi:hypothetical protein
VIRLAQQREVEISGSGEPVVGVDPTVQEGGGNMDDLSRREFLRKGSIGAVAGAVALSSGAAVSKVASAKAAEMPPTAEEATAAEPIVAYVKQGARGEVRVMVGSQEVVHDDPELARRIIRASKR